MAADVICLAEQRADCAENRGTKKKKNNPTTTKRRVKVLKASIPQT